MKRGVYPFTAIVGQEAMKTALLLNAVDPTIGGVLISGHKGTGKSTAVRGLVQILPDIEVVADCPFHCDPDSPADMCDACRSRYERGETLPLATISLPLVDLPLSATEDRIVGTLHVGDAIASGKIRFEPGLLAAANRGILYVDEVNLLDDHLVDILLDSAASGVNIVEREGISHTHPARFILVGTMNPEEGALRPQFLDRFGLFVAIKTIADEKDREKIVKRRAAWDSDPEKFYRHWQDAEQSIARRVMDARSHLKNVRSPDAMVTLSVRLAVEAGAQGHRAEIGILKTARTLAALLSQPEVTPHHIAEAALYVLPHRMTTTLLRSPETLLDKISEAITNVMGKISKMKTSSDNEVLHDEEDSGYPDEPMAVPGAFAAGSLIFDLEPKGDEVFDPDKYISAEDINLAEESARIADTGKHKESTSGPASGRYIRSVPVKKGERDYNVAVDATLRTAAIRRAKSSNAIAEPFSVKRHDLRKKVRKHFRKTLVVFVVDASDSMGTKKRMAAAKGAVLALLKTAYQKRDVVALVSVRDEQASVLLQPTTSVEMARERLKNLPTGGATPLGDGVHKAWRLMKVHRAKDPEVKPILVILSDGEANVPISPGQDVMGEIRSMAAMMKRDGVRAVVIDTQTGTDRSENMTRIAEFLDADYHHIDELKASNVVYAVRRVESELD